MANINTSTEQVHDKNKRHGINVEFTKSPLDNLKSLTKKMPEWVKEAFNSEYGNILYLLYVEVEEPAINALAQFWNGKLGIFELPNLDTTPTVEEYQELLELYQLDKVYYQGNSVDERAVLKILNIDDNPKYHTVQEPFRGLKQKSLEDHLENLVTYGNWVCARPVLALLIYGLVLFPSTRGMIDSAAQHVFFEVCVSRVNPTPAILADTFASLTVHQRKKKGKIRCCVQLLYLWMATHLHPAKSQALNRDPIQRFSAWNPFSMDKAAWREKLENASDKSYGWKCPWYKIDTVLLRCGNFSGVPLIGPRSCFMYFPSLVLRQMGWTQTVPEGEIESFCLEGKESKHKESEILSAWKNKTIVGIKELGQQIKTEIPLYIAWRKSRMEGFTPLVSIKGKSGPNAKEEALQKKTSVLQAQLKAAIVDERETKTMLALSDRQSILLKRKIKHLEGQNSSSVVDKDAMDKKGEEIKRLKEQLKSTNADLNKNSQEKESIKKELDDLNQNCAKKDKEIRQLKDQLSLSKKKQRKNEEYFANKYSEMKAECDYELDRLRQVIEGNEDHFAKTKNELLDSLNTYNYELDQAKHQINILKGEILDKERQYSSYQLQWLEDFERSRMEIDQPGIPPKVMRYFKEYDELAEMIRRTQTPDE